MAACIKDSVGKKWYVFWNSKWWQGIYTEILCHSHCTLLLKKNIYVYNMMHMINTEHFLILIDDGKFSIILQNIDWFLWRKIK